MKIYKILSVAFVLLCFTHLNFGSDKTDKEESQPNLIKNGDFSKGKRGWGTTGKVKKIGEGDKKNKAMEIELHDKRLQYLRVPIELDGREHRGLKSITVKFKVKKGKDEYKSDNELTGALKLRMIRPDGSSKFREINPHFSEEMEWATMEMSHQLKGEKSMVFAIEVFPGKGKLYFDDFVATGKK